MEDLQLGVLVVVRTSNMKISRCRLADDVKKLQQKACRTCRRIFSLFNQLNSLLGSLTKDDGNGTDDARKQQGT